MTEFSDASSSFPVPLRGREPRSVASQASFPRVVVATTAMLSFISFWRAAAIVLNDLGSSAYYAGGIAEQAVGKAAPWFMLAIMLFSYAVRAVYIESCSMFVRGGVYRVVKEAMGSTMAKFSVSALMFDYILTGPISGVSAGQYLTGFLNELFRFAHLSLNIPPNIAAEVFAVLVTIYFWRINIKGIPEGSEKALRIMYVTTVMVVVLMGWSARTAWLRGSHLPPWPLPRNLHFSPEALGWLRGSQLPYTIGLVGIFIALGHSVLAMSGEETLAQVYREIEHPKLLNLKKAAFVIFVYSLIFTSGVSFFAVMLIPDELRKNYYDNLIGGLVMFLQGPYMVRLVFHLFVVLVGALILAGAVYASIVGSNGVLNRVSEDGILPDWLRQPHVRYGTTHRIISLVAVLQLLTILLSRGNVYVLGEAYAFGVLWSFVMKAFGVLVLRYTKPGPREFRVPLNPKIGQVELPLGLWLIALTLLAIAVTNLFTKQVATVSGIAFTLVFFGIFTASEKTTQKHGPAQGGLDQFHLEFAQELSPQTVGCRPGNYLVLVSNHHRLYHLAVTLGRVVPAKRDVVVLHIHLLRPSGSGEHDLELDQLFTTLEQRLFTKALEIAEKEGKPIRLAAVASNNIYDAMVRAALTLKSSALVVARSSKMSIREQVHRIRLAWEGLPAPKPLLRLEICSRDGQVESFCLGLQAPQLTPKEIDLLHGIWLRYSEEAPQEPVHQHHVIHFALAELEGEMVQLGEQEVLRRFREYLDKISHEDPSTSNRKS
jgi:amino acid transporter